METAARSRDAKAGCDGRAVDELSYFAIWPLLDQAQDEQLALGVWKVCKRSKDS